MPDAGAFLNSLPIMGYSQVFQGQPPKGVSIPYSVKATHLEAPALSLNAFLLK